MRHSRYSDISVIKNMKNDALNLQDGYAGVGLLAKEKPIQVTYGLESEVNYFPLIFCVQ
jgi:hypothetical protein